ncbi:alpha-L-rhamnosidase [Mollisia scopiformis]|uniref:alpha-L-rhamnosidase n=1 Tax=Mollisia scopiformis TaxID=149040 RepID=A0A194XUS1_MOLSC|nr:alpha-L-rhamnosidase [Mollisia scopiformis]KUJ23886.1 alpha-L-rhamnosidase [Mollisia scopiformis]
MMVEIQSITFEHHRESLGIGETNPRISWSFTGNAQNWIQSAYELEISHGSHGSIQPEKYRVESSQSVLVPWPSKTLNARDTVRVRVRAFGTDGSTPTDWSDWNSLEVGLLAREDWQAHVIAAPRTLTPSKSLRPALFRKEFRLEKPIRSARLYVTSYGIYEAHMNGKRVGDHVLAPGWTAYKYRLNYQTHDITDLLKQGDNAIAAEVGEGWYCGRLGFNRGWRCLYGDRLSLLAQIEVTYQDNEIMRIGTDNSWKTSVGPIISSEIYDGEAYDASLEIDGWSSPVFEDHQWSGVEELDFPKAQLIAPEGPPVRKTEVVKAQQVIKTPSGKYVVDFGQNLVGWLRVHVSGPKGHTISFTHTEVLENGEAATRPLRDCKAKDSLTLSGKPITWSPKFTFHGFRYVQVDNWPTAEPKLSDLEAIVIHTDMQETGSFTCSDPMVNKLHENIRWGMRGNFVSIPTDCPQRDERLGWTGDIQIFCPTANFLYSTTGMLSSWLKDLAVEQIHDLNGVVSVIVPNILPKGYTMPQAAWSDAAIMTPWDLYTSSGDISILRTQHESMKIWLEKGVARQENGLWDPNGHQLGDWLDPAAPPSEPGNGKTDPHLVANAYLVHITHLMSLISNVLSLSSDATHYASEAERLKKLFQDEYITPNGRLAPDSMTALALAITFNLFASPTHLTSATTRLSTLVRTSKFRIATGFVGTPLILPSLTKVGKVQLAYKMLLQTRCPSWLYPITMGATTMWERWDSMLPNGSINPGEMTSFNHYALGSVGAWLHSTVGGISPLEPGWKKVLFAPRPGGTVRTAQARFLSPYGVVGWEEGKKKFWMRARVPPNTTAEVRVPGREEVVRVESGEYEFRSEFVEEGWPPKAIYAPFAQYEDMDD